MELLVLLRDKVPPDHPHHDLLPQAGDVIAYHTDSANWTRKERENPDWRIVRVAKLTKAEAEALICPELPTAPEHKLILRWRGLNLDLSVLELATPRRARVAANFAPEVLESGEVHDNTVSLKELRSARRLKSPKRREGR